jgi:hypothetical protein
LSPHSPGQLPPHLQNPHSDRRHSRRDASEDVAIAFGDVAIAFRVVAIAFHLIAISHPVEAIAPESVALT